MCMIRIAKESLEAALPEGWTMVMGDEEEHEGLPFYFNKDLSRSSYEHPMDHHYKEKFERLKKEKTTRVRQGVQHSCESNHQRGRQ